MQARQLQAKCVDLRVLGAGGFGALLRQCLLKGGQVLGGFLATVTSSLAHFTAQLALQAVNAVCVGLQHLQQLRVRLLSRGPTVLAPKHHPQQQRRIEQQQTHDCKQHHITHGKRPPKTHCGSETAPVRSQGT